MCSSDLDGGGGGKEAPLTYFENFKKLPIIRSVFKFASWVLFSLQSLLFVRMQYLVRATSTLQRALLDPKQQLQAMSLDVPATMQKIRSQSGMPTQVDDGMDAEDDARPLKAETTADWAFRSFWGSDLAVVVGQKMTAGGRGSVQSEFLRLQRDSIMQSTSHLESLAAFAGVHSSVLEFVERGGMPPSVESLYAWLEFRKIDTRRWGAGEAKTVAELFHELWAGECEPLTDQPHRVISVVKVRVLDTDAQGTWQLYETKQKFCRDGRTRPRNRPLAEKVRPGEEPVATARRGVLEELGSVLGAAPSIVVDEGNLEEWAETRMSESFPGLETVYKLFQVDVRVEGLTRASTGTSFDSVETPDEAYGKVHTWTWTPLDDVDWNPVSTSGS